MPTGVWLTELSSTIVVSPVVIPEVLPVFTIGLPLGVVGATAAGVIMTVGAVQATLIAVVLQPALWLLKLSKVLLTQPLSISEATVKAKPQT